jgi:hypothetical protein
MGSRRELVHLRSTVSETRDMIARIDRTLEQAHYVYDTAPSKMRIGDLVRELSSDGLQFRRETCSDIQRSLFKDANQACR